MVNWDRPARDQWLRRSDRNKGMICRRRQDSMRANVETTNAKRSGIKNRNNAILAGRPACRHPVRGDSVRWMAIFWDNGSRPQLRTGRPIVVHGFQNPDVGSVPHESAAHAMG